MNKTAWLLLTLLCATSAAAFEGAPYPHQVSTDRASLRWVDPSPAWVEVSAPGRAPKTWVAPAPSPLGLAELALTDLKPGETYRYAVHTPSATARGSFKTAPKAGTPFTFVIYGDNRSFHDAHAAVVAAIRPHHPELILNTGDLVANGGDPALWPIFFQIEAPLLAETVLFPVVGNHDLHGDGQARFQAFFPQSSPKLSYAFTWGNVRFIAIDTEVDVEPDQAPSAAQSAWVLQEIKQAKKAGLDHVIAFTHRGPYSSHPMRDGNPGLRRRLPAWRAAGLTMIGSGHDHFYDRGHDASGLVYVVAGGGGAPLYPVVPDRAPEQFTSEARLSDLSFLKVQVDGKKLSACGIDAHGRAFDCFTIKP